MVRKRKEDQAEFEANENGAARDFNEKASINPAALLRMGVATMFNEIGRLVDKSKATGLNGMQAHTLKEFVRTASEVLKKHPGLHVGFDTEEDIEKASPEELSRMLLEAANDLKLDLTDAVMHRGRKAKVIDHDPH